MRNFTFDGGPSGCFQEDPDIFFHHGVPCGDSLAELLRDSGRKRWKTNDQPYFSASVLYLVSLINFANCELVTAV